MPARASTPTARQGIAPSGPQGAPGDGGLHDGAVPRRLDFSVIIAHTRASIRACLDALAVQTFPAERFEVIVIGAAPHQVAPERYPFRVRYIRCEARNPSLRRNLGMEASRGDIYAFIDDDAEAREDWLASAFALFRSRKRLGLIGGPTHFPPGLGVGHKLTYKIAHAGFFGNGHENLRFDAYRFEEVRGYITSCNLFICPARLENHKRFDLRIGYGGEDTLLLHRIERANSCDILYSTAVVVFHSRGRYDLTYLKTRFRYRMNNGLMIWASPSIYFSNRKFCVGVLLGTLLLLVLAHDPLLALPLAAVHLLISFAYALRYRREDWRLSLLFPPALLVQHTVYYFGVMTGFLSVLHPHQMARLLSIRRKLR